MDYSDFIWFPYEMQSCHLDLSWDPKAVLGGLCHTDLWSLHTDLGHLNRTISHNSMQPLAILWFGFWRILRKMCDCKWSTVCPKPVTAILVGVICLIGGLGCRVFRARLDLRGKSWMKWLEDRALRTMCNQTFISFLKCKGNTWHTWH